MSAKKTVNKKADKIVKEAKELCTDLFKDKLCDVYLYGSYARGDYHKYSDVDILLTLNLTEKQIKKYNNALCHIASELSLKYDITVSITTDPIKTFYKYTEFIPFYRNVLTEGINYGN